MGWRAKLASVLRFRSRCLCARCVTHTHTHPHTYTHTYPNVLCNKEGGDPALPSPALQATTTDADNLAVVEVPAQDLFVESLLAERSLIDKSLRHNTSASSDGSGTRSGGVRGVVISASRSLQPLANGTTSASVAEEELASGAAAGGGAGAGAGANNVDTIAVIVPETDAGTGAGAWDSSGSGGGGSSGPGRQQPRPRPRARARPRPGHTAGRRSSKEMGDTNGKGAEAAPPPPPPPASPGSAAAVAAEGGHEAPEVVPQCTILIAEDSEVNQRLLLRWIELSGLTVEVLLADEGDEAVSVWRQRRNDIDLIIMDINMPHMNGIEATDVIRAEETEGEHVTIFAVSANVTTADQAVR